MKKTGAKESDKKITGKEIFDKVFKKIIEIDKLSLLERCAIFMGKTQIIELALKHLLVGKYNYKFEDLEKATLGGVICKLREKGIRADFMCLLDELLDFRNDMAHSFLSDNVIGRTLIGESFNNLSEKPLRYALLKVEEVIQVYDFLTTNKYL